MLERKIPGVDTGAKARSTLSGWPWAQWQSPLPLPSPCEWSSRRWPGKWSDCRRDRCRCWYSTHRWRWHKPRRTPVAGKRARFAWAWHGELDRWGWPGRWSNARAPWRRTWRWERWRTARARSRRERRQRGSRVRRCSIGAIAGQNARCVGAPLLTSHKQWSNEIFLKLFRNTKKKSNLKKIFCSKIKIKK